MTVLFVVLPIALIIAAVAAAAFVWATRSGQFDDLDTPGWRVLLDEEPTSRSASSDAWCSSHDAASPVSKSKPTDATCTGSPGT